MATHSPVTPPDILLILGMDGAGKNHVANLAGDYIAQLGFFVEKRAGKLSAKATDAITSEDKSLVYLVSEKLFLILFSFVRSLLPFIINFWIRRDLKQFHKNELQKIKVIVISYTALRILAFYLGHVYQNVSEIKLPPYLEKTLDLLAHTSGIQTIVLDIDNQIRQQRIADRAVKGKMDNMDKYMADPAKVELSERIESFLVWLAIKYLNAVKIENNNLGDRDLIVEIKSAFDKFSQNN
jgi:hypothetical protein